MHLLDLKAPLHCIKGLPQEAPQVNKLHPLHMGEPLEYPRTCHPHLRPYHLSQLAWPLMGACQCPVSDNPCQLLLRYTVLRARLLPVLLPGMAVIIM